MRRKIYSPCGNLLPLFRKRPKNKRGSNNSAGSTREANRLSPEIAHPPSPFPPLPEFISFGEGGVRPSLPEPEFVRSYTTAKGENPPESAHTISPFTVEESLSHDPPENLIR